MTGGGECNKKVRNSIKLTIGDTAFSHTQKEKRLPTLTSKQPRNHSIKKLKAINKKKNEIFYRG